MAVLLVTRINFKGVNNILTVSISRKRSKDNLDLVCDDCIISEEISSIQAGLSWSLVTGEAELLFTFDLRKTMRSHAVVISNKSSRRSRKLNWEPQDIAINCIESRYPKFHQGPDIWKRHLGFDFCYIIYQFYIKDFWCCQMRIEWRMSECVPGHLVRLVDCGNSTGHARDVARACDRVTTLVSRDMWQCSHPTADKWLSIQEVCIWSGPMAWWLKLFDA